MIKYASLIMMFLVSSVLGPAQDSADSIHLIANRIEIRSPKELTGLSDAIWKVKYPTRAKPTFVLSDYDATVNLICELTNQKADEKSLVAFKDFQLNQLKKSRPDLNILEEGVKDVNGKKIAYFKFLSQAIDQKIFNYMFFLVMDEKIVLFSFNCTEKLRNKWEGVADGIVSSVKVR